MKTFLIAISAVLLGAAVAHGTESGDKQPAKAARRAQENLGVVKTEQANPMVGRDLTFGGIATAAVKADNKLQLLNPFAPEEYGAAEDSVARDPVTHAVAGAAIAHDAQTNDRLQAEAARQAQETSEVVKTEKDNRIVGRNTTYSGIAVAAVKADNKLQLLNPFAPEEYGATEDSVVRDPVTHAVNGLKIFSIEF